MMVYVRRHVESEGAFVECKPQDRVAVVKERAARKIAETAPLGRIRLARENDPEASINEKNTCSEENIENNCELVLIVKYPENLGGEHSINNLYY